MDDRALRLLAIHYLEGLNTKEKLLLFELYDSVDAIRVLDRRECERTIGRHLRTRFFEPAKACSRAEEDIRHLTGDGFGYNFYWDCGYPPLLREIHDPPFLIFHRGTIPCSSQSAVIPWIGVVGTRYPTGYGRTKAFDLGREFADLGVPVVSGLAYGIDEAVHSGVVDRCGTAIAVLGNGIDSIYPKSNRVLASKIVENGGCLMSEYGPGVEPRRYHFPARNRIIAGCSRGTLVVEAPRRSGALITADFALDDGRDLFVHAAGMRGANSGGVVALADDGARIIDRGAEVLRDWSIDVDGRYAMSAATIGTILN